METMLIVTEHVTQATNDKEQLEPALVQLTALPEELGKAKALVADSGYFSQSNVKLCESKGIKPYIANRREQHYPSLKNVFQDHRRCLNVLMRWKE